MIRLDRKDHGSLACFFDRLKSQRLDARLHSLVVPIVLLVLAISIALPQVMSTLAPYDDEGYVMMTLRTFGDGHRLYGDTHTQYGPAYYLLTEPLHQSLGLPLSQDGVRFKTIAFWIAIVVLVYGSLRRLQVTQIVALVCSSLAFLHLDKLALEPGHPQEWALLLSMLAFWFLLGKSRYRFGVSAALVTFVGMIKLNCGVVAALPLLLASCLGECQTIDSSVEQNQNSKGDMETSKRGQIPFGYFGLLILMAPLIPISILALQKEPASAAPFLMGLFGIFFFWIPFRKSLFCGSIERPFRFKHLATVIGTAISVGLGIIAWTLATGTTSKELVWGLLGQHRQFTSTFFHSIPFRTESLLVGVLSLVALLPRWKANRPRIAIGLVALVSCLVSLAILADMLQPLEHGLQPRGAASLLAVIGPALAPWLFINRSSISFDRVVLATMACLGTIISFPTPGTQLAIGTLPSLMLLGVLAQDALKTVQSLKTIHSLPQAPSLSGSQYGRFAVLVLMFLGSANALVKLYQWRTNQPLELEGSSWVRLPADRAEQEIALARAIEKTGCKFLVFDGHTHNRFFFWTKTKPLTAANPTFWPRMLQEREQQDWLEQLACHPKVCVVIPTESDRLAGEHASNLRSEIRRDFQLSAKVSDWKIGIRKQTTTMVSTESSNPESTREHPTLD